MSKKSSGPKWVEKHYREALKALRASGLFRGLDAADGYDLRKPLSPGRKSTIRKLTKQMAVIQARPHVVVTPKTRAVERAMKKTMGIRSGKLKRIPVPVMPNEKVSVRLGEGNRIFIRYDRMGLEQIICPLNLKEIAGNIDYSLEEEEQKDSLAIEYFRAAVEVIKPVDDGNAFFRINSSSGDINPERYASTQFFEDLEAYFERLVNRYSDVKINAETGEKEVQLLDFVTGISVMRNIGRDAWTREAMNATTYDYTRPIRVVLGKTGVKVTTTKRHSVARKKKPGKKPTTKRSTRK